MKRMRRIGWRRREKGSSAVELVIVFGVGVVPFFALMIVAGRLTLAHQAAEAAAFDAARTASISRDESTARSRAGAEAMRSFQSQGIACVTLNVVVDTDGFRVPVGQPATVWVQVTCQVRLADVAVQGTPGSVTLSGEFRSPLDRYRTRTSAP